jgi:hypothetical protein
MVLAHKCADVDSLGDPCTCTGRAGGTKRRRKGEKEQLSVAGETREKIRKLYKPQIVN